MKWRVARHVANRSDHTPIVMRATVSCTARASRCETRLIVRGWRPNNSEAFARDVHCVCFGPDSSSQRVEGSGVGGQRSGGEVSVRPEANSHRTDRNEATVARDPAEPSIGAIVDITRQRATFHRAPRRRSPTERVSLRETSAD